MAGLTFDADAIETELLSKERRNSVACPAVNAAA